VHTIFANIGGEYLHKGLTLLHRSLHIEDAQLTIGNTPFRLRLRR